jgi:hypothetical protein
VAPYVAAHTAANAGAGLRNQGVSNSTGYSIDGPFQVERERADRCSSCAWNACTQKVLVRRAQCRVILATFLLGGWPPRYAQDGMREVVALFMREDRRLTAALLIRPADSQRVHAVLEHPAANSQEVGGMGLNVVGPFEGV